MSESRIPEALPLRALLILGGESTDQPSTGGQIRRHHLLRAVGRIATLDIFLVKFTAPQVLDRMSSIYGARVGCGDSFNKPRSRIGRLARRLRHAGSPTRVAMRDWRGLRHDLTAWMSSYDLTIVEDVEDFLIVAPVLPAPVVVDHDDRHSDLVRHIRTQLHVVYERRRRQPGLLGWVRFVSRRTARDLYLRLEEYRWIQAERFLARRADSLLVASHEDQLNSRSPQKAVVVPNGFELRGPPAGARDIHTPPTVTFWGTMSYPPNRFGAEWMVAEVVPLLVELIPDVRVMIVGGGGELLPLPKDGHVVATGFVEDLSTVLSETDVAAVPLQAGGGTRIKIIEAWANNIPVVSTSVGAYGLGAIDGENVLIGDDPLTFARAIASAMEDPKARDRLIEGGAARARALRWSTIEKDLSDYLTGLAAREASG